MPDVPFSPPAFDALLTLAEAMGVTPAEAVRRALILLDAYCQLNEGESLAVYNEGTKTTEKLTPRWTHSDGSDAGNGAA